MEANRNWMEMVEVKVGYQNQSNLIIWCNRRFQRLQKGGWWKRVVWFVLAMQRVNQHLLIAGSEQNTFVGDIRCCNSTLGIGGFGPRTMAPLARGTKRTYEED